MVSRTARLPIARLLNCLDHLACDDGALREAEPGAPGEVAIILRRRRAGGRTQTRCLKQTALCVRLKDYYLVERQRQLQNLQPARQSLMGGGANVKLPGVNRRTSHIAREDQVHIP